MSGPLGHWHPVLLSRELGRRPREVRLHDQTLAVFRTERGVVGAIDGVCIHRGMRLSEGRVEGERLQCPYHGWAFGPEGDGSCPAQPERQLKTIAFDAVERHGTIWVKAKGSAAVFPTIEHPGLNASGVLRHRVRAPMQLVVDNFTEVEHTPTTHALFGYSLDAMADVVCEVELTPATVRVFNKGRQKPMPWAIERAFGIRGGDDFIDDWTSHFSPVHTIYDQYCADPLSGAERPLRLRLFVFFTPVDAWTTDLFTFAAARSGDTLLDTLIRPIAPALLRRLLDREVRLDQRMIERLASHDLALHGRRLGRFDKALAENRKRVASLYFGTGSGGAGSGTASDGNAGI